MEKPTDGSIQIMINETREMEIIRLQQHKIDWLENRYKQVMKIMADAVASTLPLDLQQKLFLDVAKRTKAIQDAEITRKQD